MWTAESDCNELVFTEKRGRYSHVTFLDTESPVRLHLITSSGHEQMVLNILNTLFPSGYMVLNNSVVCV